LQSKEAIQAWIIAHLSEETGIDAREIDPNAAFDDLGVASRDAVTLSGDLEDWLGRTLSPTLLWDHPSIAALAEHLAGGAPLAGSATAHVLVAEVHEPIAIIGIGLKVPGASSPSEFWSMLIEGRDAIGAVPADRWDNAAYYDPNPGTAGKMYTERGGFLDRVDLFDADFFGIPPREAARMDPQQRLLIEAAWEALEDAGIAPPSLAGSDTSVFVGISSSDYAQLQMSDPSLVDAYAGTGNAHSLAANRISYFLDLRGPSVAIDTACSSSLVAVHQAVGSLRKGESSIALAGGVNVLLSPEVNMVFSHARMMAPDGRCKTFDATADGYVRGEGCGVVVLKRLSRAVADGDSIYAVIRGTAINHDGRSNGITAPNGLAQQDVIRRALADAGLQSTDVGYVEAHGTGTSLGDPIEVESLKAVLLPSRDANAPVVLGALKTNIGHLEAAAGIVGLIKTALVLDKGVIPATLHVREVNPLIQLDGTPMRIAVEQEPWPRGARPRIAGVSSFGFGGANAHAVLEEAPETANKKPAHEDRPQHVLALSAKTESALRTLAGSYANELNTHPGSFPDFCYTANIGRSGLENRASILGSNAADAVAALREIAQGETPKPVVAGTAPRGASTPVAFLFTGQGSQFVQMGRGLYESNPVFRRVMQECDEVLGTRLDKPLLDIIYPREGETSPLDETAYTQPALFAIEYALSEVWRSWGVTPACVMGHSVGEYVAACVAGVFTFEDGLKLITERARLMGAMPPGGTMAAVLIDAETVKLGLAEHAGAVTIAAVNGPANTVISGAEELVDAICAQFKAQGIKSVKLAVSHAFHSPLMDPMLEPFEKFAAGFTFKPPRIPLVSNLIGQIPAADFAFDAAYWRKHLREAVQFHAGIQSMVSRGYTTFVEAGPQATLSSMAARCVEKDAAAWLPSLAKGQDDWHVILRSLQTLYVKGASINWKSFDAPYSRARVPIPTYPFERKRHWLDVNAQVAGAPVKKTHPMPTRLPSKDMGDWLYHVRWIEQPRQPATTATPTHWILLADTKGVADALAQRIRARGGRAVLVRHGASYIATGSDEVILDPASDIQFDQLWNEFGTGCGRVVHLWSLDAPALEEATLAALHRAHVLGCGAALHLIQSITASGEQSGRNAASHPRRLLWCITRGAQVVAASTAGVQAAQAPLWGFGRSAALENAALWGGMIDLDPLADANDIEALLFELDAPDAENQMALRGGARYVARFARIKDALPTNGIGHIKCREDATYVVTGGLGGLGLQVAKWLGDRGAKHIVLFGRTPLPSRDQWETLSDDARERVDAVQALEARGVAVRCEPVDVSDETALQSFIDAHARNGMPAIRGIVHAAGVIDDHTVNELSMDSLTAVMRPKVDGTMLLHRHFGGHGNGSGDPLDFFVMFSSVASVMGSPGQANYAAGNAFMDALAHHRRAQGRTALSINWGPWAEVGIASRGDIQKRLSMQGIGCIQPEDGIAALDSLLSADAEQVGVLQADWDKLVTRAPGIAESPLFAELLNGHAKRAEAAPGKPLGRGVASDVEAIEALLRRQVAQILYRDEEEISVDRNFGELGLDSIMLMELVNSVERDIGVRLFPKELFDRPTIAALAPYLVGEVAKYEARVEGKAPSTGAGVRVALPAVRLKKIGPAVRNKPIAFLLSAPRSGSTLSRVMLAGHKDLFCPPELHFLQCNSMGEWREGIGATYISEGLQRALMELHNLDADAARVMYEQWVREDWPVEKAYAAIQEAAGPRLLIDKSPSYGTDIEVLEHAERLFDGPKYIHLVRHPYSVIESFMRNRFEKILGDTDAEPMALAEEVWTLMNANISDFLSTIDDKRKCLVHYEDIVAKPEETMQRLCEFLDVPYDPAVIKPYEGERMTDGIHNKSMGIGDPNFLKHKEIDPSLGEVWKRIRLPRKLGGFARRVAAELEYVLPVETPGSINADLGISSTVPHVVAIQPKGDRPPFFCCAPAGGMTYMYFHLPRYLGDDQPIYGLQDPALNPLFDPHTTMESLCAEQAKAIRKIQPNGPYYLGGWSFGGAVAFETAQQLMAAGEQVAYLGIIDTEARIEKHRAKTWKDRLRLAGGQLKMSFKVIGHWGPYAKDFIYIILPSALKKKDKAGEPSLWEYITFAWADAIRHTLVKRADIANVVTRDSRVLLVKQPATRRTLKVLKANLRALLAYKLKPYPGTITLLRAEDQTIMHKLHEDWTLGWGDLAQGGLDVVEVPGNHAVLLSPPYIERVGEVLREGIDKAMAKYGATPDTE